MNLNATLFAELFWFLLFVVFTMKYVWPPILKNMDARRTQIADGLAAAEKGQRELELAAYKSKLQQKEAKVKAADIIDQAHARVSNMLEDARMQARKEGGRLLELAQQEIEQSYHKAKMELQQEVGLLALAIAEKLVRHRLDAAANQALIDDFMGELIQKDGKGADAK